MKKTIISDNIYYTLAWSKLYKYDRHEMSKVLPELSGIISLQRRGKRGMEDLLFHECWRDGCRVGLKKLLDPFISKHGSIAEKIISESEFFYRYTEIDSSASDMQDILHWLIKNYQPLYNHKDFDHSKRFKKVFVKEVELDKDSVVERLPGFM